MSLYIQYHNGDKEGFKYLFADVARFGVYTRLAHAKNAQGTVFLIVGAGKPRQYFLWEAFEIDEVAPQDGGIYHVNGSGWRLCPPQRLIGADFDAFRNSCANFIGFRKVDHLPYCATLKTLAKKHRSEKSMKPFLQELLGMFKDGTEDYEIVEKLLGPPIAASKQLKPSALPQVQKRLPTKKVSRQPSKSSKLASVQTQNGEQTKHLRALSIRQPHAEAIMRGIKKIEYRSLRTQIRGRVQIYASLGRFSQMKEAALLSEKYKMTDVAIDDLPRGVLIGTVEVSDCTFDGVEFNWHLRNPERATQFLKPKKQPQPVWFKPF